MWQHSGHGKPRQEQNQIGAAWVKPKFSILAVRVDCLNLLVTADLDE